jgi:hypothetical protein
LDPLIAYHVFTEGRCFANIVGEQPIAIKAGEVIVFTKGDPHVLSSSPGMRAGPAAPVALDTVPESQLPFFINYGSDGPVSAKFVCGYLACDAQPYNPLLDHLPPVIKAGDPQSSSAGWLGQFIRVAIIESKDKRAGGESVLAKLSELMFIEVIRRHLETLPPEQAGWLAGLRDPFVGKAFTNAREAGAQLDDRATRQGCRTIALSVGGALRRSRWHAANALSRKMANADRFWSAEPWQRQYCNRCGRNRLRI